MFARLTLFLMTAGAWGFTIWAGVEWAARR